MSPEQIADSILTTRFPTTHPGTAFYQNARTMIVDGIERALAERAVTGTGQPADHIDRMRVARRYAAWHIGDGEWAPVIVGAYLDHERAATALAEEMEE